MYTIVSSSFNIQFVIDIQLVVTTFILLYRLLRILKTSHSFETKKIKITVSIGISHFASDDDSTPELMLKLADEVLRQAKKKGKNCIMLAQAYKTRNYLKLQSMNKLI